MWPLDVGINGSKFRAAVSSGSGFNLGTPCLPMAFPGHETVLFVMDPVMNFPLEPKQPFQFHRIQIGDGNIANFGPRPILKRIVIEELAAKEERCCEHTIDLTTSRPVHFSGRKHAHPRRQVVKGEKDGRAW